MHTETQHGSKIVSHIGPRQMRPLEIEKDKATIALAGHLKKLGIGFDASDIRDMISGTGYDAIQGLVTIANSAGVPAQFLQEWLPGFVRILTAARMGDELLGITTVGSWEDAEVVQGIMENTGQAVPYGDYTTVPFTDWNLTWERRSIVRFEEGLRVGKLEEARSARARVNSANEKREGAALLLEVQRNNICFYGYNNGLTRTYGFLNEPNLPSYQTVAPGSETGSPTSWNSKNTLEIINDLRVAMALLRTVSQNNVKPERDAITIAVALNKYDRLTTVTEFGYSIKKWMEDNYKNVRIIGVPELNGANGGVDVFYAYAESVPDRSSDNGATFMQIVPAKFQTVGVAKMTKYYEEDYTNATAGVLLKRPYAVVRFTGI